ncbi:hypothetical protein [Streptomyces chattanoogensis]|uniref:Uncharacterized protein n=1 Tax=Streptomyces chattanoogensis TaxID=66876 RepID=A0A0N0GUL0_9ACTN|nr:hypothetical protein [Streptomyces chattanoogensis]KPC58531.1 hypothetical protein ADL29_39595 [Streptomyces chattanoogensis]
MLIVDAVLETFDAAEFVQWPVADVPAHRLLALSGRLSPLEVGVAMATLADYNSDSSDRDGAVVDGSALVRRLVEAECVIAPGGLRVRDTGSGVTVAPGCCCGLEDWREWLGLVDGDVPWLGHDPSPRMECVGRVVRLWPDGGDSTDSTETPQGPPIEIPADCLTGILRTVQDELSGFLALVERWADRHVPGLAPALATKLDEDLDIGAPLLKGGS